MNTKDQKPGWFKSKVIGWLGLSELMTAATAGGKSSSGVTVTADRALTISAVWACARLVSQTVATLPLDVYQRNGDGTREARSDHAVARMIHSRPNSSMTAVTFWEAMILNVLLWGNGFAEKRRLNGRVVALHFMRSDRTSWQKLENGRIQFAYARDDGKIVYLDEDDVFHIPGFTMDGQFGMSVIRYGSETMGTAIAANQAAGSTFKNGLLPTVYYKMDKILRKEQRQEFRDEVISQFSGALNAGKSPLLEGGMEADTIGINPNDAQLLESRTFSVEDVCRWFGVPPSMVGSTDKASSWASSSEQINLWFLQYGLRPILKRIEEAIWFSLLSPSEQGKYYAEFSVEGLLRADTKTRSELYASALQNGWMNRNTVARLENAPMIPGGDIYTVQSNLISLERIGDEPGDGEKLRQALSKFMKESEHGD